MKKNTSGSYSLEISVLMTTRYICYFEVPFTASMKLLPAMPYSAPLEANTERHLQTVPTGVRLYSLKSYHLNLGIQTVSEMVASDIV